MVKLYNCLFWYNDNYNMQEQEKSSVAVVTGSSSGIGLDTSLLLARSRLSYICYYA